MGYPGSLLVLHKLKICLILITKVAQLAVHYSDSKVEVVV